jgi:hypothetical protein
MLRASAALAYREALHFLGLVLCDLLDSYVSLNRSLAEKAPRVPPNSSMSGNLVLGEECPSRTYFYVNIVTHLLAGPFLCCRMGLRLAIS